METYLVAQLRRLQERAQQIVPPPGRGIAPARGGLRGPAFFPEGFGLTESALHGGQPPEVMVIGHNFGCVDYRERIEGSSREDDKQTWANLDRLLQQSGVDASAVFRTNWFVGLIQEKRQTGKFLRRPHVDYERHCCDLLREQIRLVKPKALLVLGTEVASRCHELAPALSSWKGAKCWRDIDRSSIGFAVRDVSFLGTGVTANIGSLLHPSFGLANQGRRMKGMLQPTTESAIVTSVCMSGDGAAAISDGALRFSSHSAEE